MAKDGVRVSFNNNRCTVRFYKNAIKLFNGPYVKPIGKGAKLYFYPSTPTKGMLISEKNGIQIGRRDYVDSMRRYEGIHKMLFDEGLRVYYIDTEPQTEEPAEQIEEIKPEPKAEKRAKKYELADVTSKLAEVMVGCIDGDDLAGAKAILKAMRAFGEKI